MWSAVTRTGSSLTAESPTVRYIDAGGTMHDGMPASPSSLHADARGELYLTTTNGGVFRLEAGT